MKNRILYLGLIFSLAIILICLVQIKTQNKGIALGNTAESKEVPEEWQNIIASDINAEKLKLVVDGKNISFDKQNLYMDDNMNIMIPAYVFPEVFQCSFNLYNDHSVIMQRGNTIINMNRYLDYISIGNQKISLKDAYDIVDSRVFVNASVLELALGYKYQWNSKTNVLELTNEKKGESILPASYSYRAIGKLPSVKNQGSLSTCWAFASLTALETSLRPTHDYIFSVDNMVSNSGYSSKQNEGGDYTRAIAYLASWRGPVLEEDDVYGDGICNTDAKPVKHVQEAQIIESKNLEAIKKAVFFYGGVESSLYTSMTKGDERSMFYNDINYAYCYIGTQKPNHDVVIVGWDDSYPKENFNADLEADGAFLCMNSWGESFGDDGLFYVSYFDSNIGIHNVVYTGVEEKDNYDNIYQSDLCGWVGQLGYEEESAYFSNVYEAESTENLAAVGFYATGKNTSYEIYAVEDFHNVDSFDQKYYVQSGFVTNAGYYTVNLKDPIFMDQGKKYAIIIKISTPNAVHPIAIEYKAGKATKDVILEDGEGYISLTGKTWEHVEESKSCNLCLKFYTNYVNYNKTGEKDD